MLALAVLFLAACGTAADPRPVYPTDLPARDSDESAFLDAVHLTEPALEYEDDSILIRIGHDYCDQLDAGLTVEAILLGDTTLEPRARGVVIGGAVYLFCPAHTDDVDGFVERWG